MTRDTFFQFQNSDRGLFGDNEQAPSRSNRARVTNASDLLDLALCLHHETERAVLVSGDADESHAQWLPKSRIEIEKHKSIIRGRRKNGTPVNLLSVTVTLPESLAVGKGLV